MKIYNMEYSLYCQNNEEQKKSVLILLEEI